MRFRPIPPWLVFVALLVAIGLAAALEQSFNYAGWRGFLGGAAVLIAFVCWSAAPTPLAGSASPPLSRVGAVLSLGGAIFFRTRYVWSVPSGYGFEALAFVFFARRLADEGFPYVPYAWYAHTLYSYAIAAALPFAGSELVAARLASAAISIATVIVLYGCSRLLFGAQIAWIAVGLLGPSWWHLWASRNGYHQFLMPPFHLLFMAGVVAAIRDARRWGFFLAGVTLIGALHAYWGLYLMLPYTGLLGVYVLLWHRDALVRQARVLGIAVVVTLGGLIPLGWFFVQNREVFGYTARAFSPQMSDAADRIGKLANNGWYILGALSGYEHAPVQYGSVVDPVVGAAALIGMGLCLRWWRTSLAHAAVLLLFVVNVAGLLLTMVNYFYITATMASMYLFAAVALGEAIGAAQRAFPRLRSVAALGLMALLAWRSAVNYDIFFKNRILDELQSPFRPTGRAYRILDTVAEFLPTSTVFIARHEPGRDFAEEIFELGERIPSFAFMRGVEPLDARRIFFPEQRLIGGRAAELLVPNEPYVDSRLVPILRQLYPHLSVQREAAPEPYRSVDPTPVFVRVELPWSDLAEHFGLRWSPGFAEGTGLFVAPGDGAYEWRLTGRWEGTFELDGRAVVPGQVVYLEDGPHRMRLKGWAGSSLGVDYRVPGGEWTPIDAMVVNPGSVPESDIEPYLARPGRLADFFYEFRNSLQVGQTIRDAPVAPSGDVAAIAIDGVSLLGPLGEPRWRVPLVGPRDYRGLYDSGQLLVVDPNGALVPVSLEGPKAAVPLGCGPIDVTTDHGQILALCSSGEVRRAGVEGRGLVLRGPGGAPLATPVAMRCRKDRLMVLDARFAEILSYDLGGEPVGRWVMPNVWGDSELVVGEENELFVYRWHYGWRTYGEDGALLFHPVTHRPWLFSHTGESVGNQGLRHLQIGAGVASLVSPDGHIDVYQRRLLR